VQRYHGEVCPASPPHSTLLLLKRRIEALELDACILRAEAPVDLGAHFVAPFLPGSHLCFESLEVGHSPIEALSAEHAQLDLGHVEPRAVLGRVVDLQLVVASCLASVGSNASYREAGVWVFRFSAGWVGVG
jgi:hypothetical protein